MQVEPQREPFAKRDLYGGAMEFVLPNRFMDIRYEQVMSETQPTIELQCLCQGPG
jgi:hypothetical protein